jgi:8-oxo-dGTP diphosphatase
MSPGPNCISMAASTSDLPSPPVLAVSIAVFRDGQVLLAKRGKPPALGLYSLPGGKVERGETLQDAVHRELAEEVGLIARLHGFVGHVEHIERDETGEIRAHAVIAVYAGHWVSGTPSLSDEATDLIWVNPDAPKNLPMTRGLLEILARAARIIAAPPLF